MSIRINPDFNAGKEDIREIKEVAKKLADLIIEKSPDSPQKARALMDLQSAQMFAVSAFFGDS